MLLTFLFCATVASDVNTRSAILEMCKDNILFYLIEEFLTKREILVYDDASREKQIPCGFWTTKIIDRDKVATLHSERAKFDQLMAGAVILACICRAVDNISFMCETSYIILRECREDPSLVLTVLHSFASICGKKYIEMEDFSVVMSGIKAIVWLLEQELELLGNQSGFSPCLQCPFVNGRIPIEQSVLQLMDELLGNAKSCDRRQVKEGIDISVGKFYSYDLVLNSKQVSSEICPIVVSSFGVTDVVSMLELIAYYMVWPLHSVALLMYLFSN